MTGPSENLNPDAIKGLILGKNRLTDEQTLNQLLIPKPIVPAEESPFIDALSGEGFEVGRELP